MPPLRIPERPLQWTRSLGDFIQSVSWSPSGTLLAVAESGGPLRVLDTQTGDIRQDWSGHEGGSFAAHFSPTEERIVSVGQDGQVRLWEPAHREARNEIPVSSQWIELASWSPDGRSLAIGAGREVLLMGSNGTIRHRLPPRKSTVTALAWRGDSTRIAAASYGAVQIWDAQSGEPEAPLEWKTSLISLAWSPDHRWLVAGTQEQAVQIWELPFKAGEELAMSGYSVKVRELCWHFGGRYLATGDGQEIMVWDCQGKGPAGTSPKILSAHAHRIARLAYQRAGHLLASADESGEILVWNAGKGGDPLRRHRAQKGVSALSWSPDGRRLALGCEDGTVAVAIVEQ